MKPELLFENTWAVQDAGVRIFILAGTERALIIDSGMTGIDGKALAAQVTPLPCALLNTHADPDHIAGNAQFSSFYMHPSDAFLYYKIHRMSGEMIPVYDGDRMDLGGRPLEIIHLPVQRKNLFTGLYCVYRLAQKHRQWDIVHAHSLYFSQRHSKSSRAVSKSILPSLTSFL